MPAGLKLRAVKKKAMIGILNGDTLVFAGPFEKAHEWLETGQPTMDVSQWEIVPNGLAKICATKHTEECNKLARAMPAGLRLRAVKNIKKKVEAARLKKEKARLAAQKKAAARLKKEKARIAAAEKKAEAARIAAEKKAEKARLAAQKKAEKEEAARIAAEKKEAAARLKKEEAARKKAEKKRLRD